MAAYPFARQARILNGLRMLAPEFEFWVGYNDRSDVFPGFYAVAVFPGGGSTSLRVIDHYTGEVCPSFIERINKYRKRLNDKSP
jgi:hypothetical protein